MIHSYQVMMKDDFQICYREIKLLNLSYKEMITLKTISAIKHNGALSVNGRSVTVRKEMAIGDHFEVHMPIETPSSNLLPYPKPLDIVYEDEFILIVNKPQLQNCAPSRNILMRV